MLIHRQVFVDPGLEGYQRTKTSSWSHGAGAEQKLQCLVTVFRWSEMAYHAKFGQHEAYDPNYKAILVSICVKAAAMSLGSL